MSERNKATILDLVAELRTNGYHRKNRAAYLKPYQKVGGQRITRDGRDKILGHSLDVPIIEAYFPGIHRGLKAEDPVLPQAGSALTFADTLNDISVVAHRQLETFLKAPIADPRIKGFVQGYNSIDVVGHELWKRHMAAVNNALEVMQGLHELGPKIYDRDRLMMATKLEQQDKDPDQRPPDEVLVDIMQNTLPLVMTFAMRVHRQDFLRFIYKLNVGQRPIKSYAFSPEFFKVKDYDPKQGIECTSPDYKEFVDCTHTHTTPLVGCPAGLTEAIAQAWEVFNNDAKQIYTQRYSVTK